jgi:aubergine
MYRSEHLTKWCVIFPRDLSHPTHEFINLLKRVGKSMNYRIDDPLQQQIDRGHNDNYRDAIMSIVGKNPQLIFVVLSTNNAQSYTLVKTLTCVANSIPSQVVVGRTITPKNPKGLMSIATKVAVQINCKLGGSPWFIQFPLSGVMVSLKIENYENKLKCIKL